MKQNFWTPNLQIVIIFFFFLGLYFQSFTVAYTFFYNFFSL